MDALPLDRWPQEDQPLVRIRDSNPDALTDSDLLAALIGGRSEKDLSLARALLDQFGGVTGLARAGHGELVRAGLTELRATRVRAGLLLARSLATSPLSRAEPFRTGRDVYEAFRGRLVGLPRERFYVLLLDARNRPYREVLVSEGSLTASIVHPREVFHVAIREAAAAVLFVHNHPSGDPKASGDDIEITKRLRKTGELVGIRVVDHVIVAAEGYTSFAESGWPDRWA